MVEFEQVSGEWWVATAPGQRVPGTLRLDARTGGLLSVNGKLDVREPAPGRFIEGTTIYGRVHGSPSALTLLRSHLVGESTRDFGKSGSTVEQRFEIFGVLASHNFPQDDPPIFSTVPLSIKGPTEWARRGKPTKHSSTEDDDGTIIEHFTFTRPPPQVFHMPQGELTLWWGGSEQFGITEVRKTLEARWTFEPTDPMTIDEVEHSVLRPLRYLHVIMTGQPTSESRISVGIDIGEEHPDYWEFLPYRHYEVPDASGPWFTWPLRLDVLRDPQDSLARWFTIYAQCGYALFGLLSILSREGEQLTVETELFLLSQCAEAYHRCSDAFANRVETYKQHRERVIALCEGESGELRQWVASRLRG